MAGRRESPIDPRAPYATFAYGLRALKAASGKPYRKIAHDSFFCASVLSSAASGWRLPTAVTLAFVRACQGDEAEWTDRWHAEHVRGGRLR